MWAYACTEMTGSVRLVGRLFRVARVALRAAAYLTLVSVIWLALGLPIGIDRWLDVSAPPIAADVIVCLGGGTTSFNLPEARGWERIYSTVELYAGGFAPAVVFTGGGNETMSEAEIYAAAGEWLGIPRAAIALDPLSMSTGDHPSKLLEVQLPDGARITHDTRLLLVTSNFHTRRVQMTFARAGYRHFRLVSTYRSSRPTSLHAQRSQDTRYTPRVYTFDDPFLQLGYRSSTLLGMLRELVAIGWYRVRGVA